MSRGVHNTSSRAGRSLHVPSISIAFAFAAAGCADSFVPEQGQFAPLESLKDSGLSVVRLYAAPLACLETVAVHPWFVVKSADSTSFSRWEVWVQAEQPYGHVRKNMLPPTADLGSGEAYVLAERIGAEADLVVTFIETCSPAYPCRQTYVLLPGPNSSTYAQWVLDCTGWDVTLPPAAIGKDVPPGECP